MLGKKIILMCLLLPAEPCLAVVHQNQKGERLHGVAANPLVFIREMFLPARLSNGSSVEMHVEDAMGLGVFPSSHEALDQGQNTLVLHTKSTQVFVKNPSWLETTFTSSTPPLDRETHL